MFNDLILISLSQRFGNVAHCGLLQAKGGVKSRMIVICLGKVETSPKIILHCSVKSAAGLYGQNREQSPKEYR